MFHGADSKSIVKILGTATTNGETVTANIDRLGFDYAAIDVIMGTSNVVSNKPSTLKLAESDDTVVSNFADITAFVAGGTGGFTNPAANTSSENLFRFNVDLRGRKRYLKLTVTPLTTQAVVMAARLSNPRDAADVSATTAGATVLVNG